LNVFWTAPERAKQYGNHVPAGVGRLDAQYCDVCGCVSDHHLRRDRPLPRQIGIEQHPHAHRAGNDMRGSNHGAVGNLVSTATTTWASPAKVGDYLADTAAL
jgi:hypothetical protein